MRPATLRHSPAGFEQAAALLLNEGIDEERLDWRADEEGLAAALGELRALSARIEAAERIQDVELAAIARQLESRGYAAQDDA